MKVILLQDVPNLGKKYEVKEVKNGFARNSLIPQGLVKLATKENLRWLENEKKNEEKKAEDDLKMAQDVASRLDGLEVVLAVRIGEDGQFFESVNAQKVAEKIKELGFDVKKSQIGLDKPIKELGEFPLKIKLEHNLEAEITLIITQEKEK